MRFDERIDEDVLKSALVEVSVNKMVVVGNHNEKSTSETDSDSEDLLSFQLPPMRKAKSAPLPPKAPRLGP